MLNVIKAGFFTTLQDQGRFLFRNMGVPVSGVMDTMAVSKINALLENDDNDAVLEITMTGPVLSFEEPTFIALGGAEMAVFLNNLPIRNYRVYQIKKGDVLSYGKLENGIRNYLGVKGGFTTEPILGSRSFYKPVTQHNSVKDHTSLPYGICKDFKPKITELKVDASIIEAKVLKVYKGPEFQQLHPNQLEQLFYTEFSVAKENNRMAYQVNETIEGHQVSMLTSATLPGTVQLTPAGKLIILMKDGQTTGGYPRILQLSDEAIAVLSQKKSGDHFAFKLI